MKNDIKELISEYARLAELHSSLDSFDPNTTKKVNDTADKIIQLADQIYQDHGTTEFQTLLRHELQSVRSWAAFNIIERMNPDQKTIETALNVIEELAKSDSVNSIGAEFWLKDWRAKHGR